MVNIMYDIKHFRVNYVYHTNCMQENIKHLTIKIYNNMCFITNKIAVYMQNIIVSEKH